MYIRSLGGPEVLLRVWLPAAALTLVAVVLYSATAPRWLTRTVLARGASSDQCVTRTAYARLLADEGFVKTAEPVALLDTRGAFQLYLLTVLLKSRYTGATGATLEDVGRLTRGAEAILVHRHANEEKFLLTSFVRGCVFGIEVLHPPLINIVPLRGSARR